MCIFDSSPIFLSIYSLLKHIICIKIRILIIPNKQTDHVPRACFQSINLKMHKMDPWDTPEVFTFIYDNASSIFSIFFTSLPPSLAKITLKVSLSYPSAIPLIKICFFFYYFIFYVSNTPGVKSFPAHRRFSWDSFVSSSEPELSRWYRSYEARIRHPRHVSQGSFAENRFAEPHSSEENIASRRFPSLLVAHARQILRSSKFKIIVCLSHTLAIIFTVDNGSLTTTRQQFSIIARWERYRANKSEKALLVSEGAQSISLRFAIIDSTSP